jgi:hypothetical protein
MVLRLQLRCTWSHGKILISLHHELKANPISISTQAFMIMGTVFLGTSRYRKPSQAFADNLICSGTTAGL